MMVDEVAKYGGDILKFAGDAFFAEWRVETVDAKEAMSPAMMQRMKNHPLTGLRASLLGVGGDLGEPATNKNRTLEECVLSASLCAASMVAQFSDFIAAKSQQLSISFGMEQGKIDAMLNVHCGVGVGTLVGLHVGDAFLVQRDDQEDEAVENRREFLFLGDPIDQVSKAADAASDGEVLASPEAIALLKETCRLPKELLEAKGPVRIAARGTSYVKPRAGAKQSTTTVVSKQSTSTRTSLYETLVARCADMDRSSLARLYRQLSLYVHHVVRGDELDSTAAQHGNNAVWSRDASLGRQREEAELRLVYTMFIKAVMSPKISGNARDDKRLYDKLQRIMQVTCRELHKFSGHLRQFIVDDKGMEGLLSGWKNCSRRLTLSLWLLLGVVLIGTFGLRGSTFANM